MIEEALVEGFDGYFDKTYLMEPCQKKCSGYMFKINDSHEYYWNNLFPNELYDDTNNEVHPSGHAEIEQPVEYAYQYGAN